MPFRQLVPQAINTIGGFLLKSILIHSNSDYFSICRLPVRTPVTSRLVGIGGTGRGLTARKPF